MSIPANKLGWMAGVLDMKGKIIRKNNHQRATPQLVIMVETKSMEIIRELSSLTGTRPEYKSSKPIPIFMRKGCQEHCPEKHVHVNDYDGIMPPICRWTLTGAAAAVIIYNLEPYLISDNRLVEAMNEIIENTPLRSHGSGGVYIALRRLKEIGWEMPEKYDRALREHSSRAFTNAEAK